MCYEEEYHQYGISKELTEEKWYSPILYNDDSEYNWVIAISPQTERNDLFYLKVYNNREVDGRAVAMYGATKCARINMKAPEYIQCDDDGKETWVFTKDELKHFCEIINDRVWNSALHHYDFEVGNWDLYKDIKFDIEHFPMPDYSKLPTI